MAIVKATIYTFNRDQLQPTVDPPTVMAVIDFEGGGRMPLEMTDRNPEDVKLGMSVEITFRRMHKARDMYAYYWKCRPIR